MAQTYQKPAKLLMDTEPVASKAPQYREFVQQLAGLPYEEQVQCLRPRAPMRMPDPAPVVQM